MLLLDIAQPKPRHESTDLVREGQSGCLVVAPLQADYHRLGRRVVNGLREWTGVEPELRAPAEIGLEDLVRRHLILIGNAAVNEWIWKLYRLHLCFTDTFYPGAGGFEVRTIHNPWGTARNVLLLGGSDQAAAQRAVVSFNRSLRQAPNQQVVLRRLNFSSSPHHVPIEPDAEVADRLMARARHFLLAEDETAAATWEVLHQACDVGLYYYQTDRQEWASIFRSMVFHYIQAAQQREDWWLGAFGEGEAAGWQWKFALVWDLIEESPCFSDEDRLAVDRMLLRQAELLAGLCVLSKEKGGQALPPAQATAAALSLHRLLALLGRGYGASALRAREPFGRAAEEVAVTRCQEEIRRWFQQAATWVSCNNVSGSARWRVAEYLMTYLLEEEDVTYPEAGRLHRLARLAVATTDSRGDEVVYGEVDHYQPGIEFPSALTNLLLKAATYEQDGDLMAFREWVRGTRPEFRYQIEGALWDWPWYTCACYASVPPAERLELGRGIQVVEIEGQGDLGRSPGGAMPTGGVAFDKLAFRGGFDPESEYLLLNGLGGGPQGHHDANAILRLTWQDRIWLADLHTGHRLPKHHSAVHILKDGRYLPPPSQARLEYHAESGRWGYTRTALSLTQGVTWRRQVLWEKGIRFLVVDTVVCTEPGLYQVDALWRLLGQPVSSATGLTVEQDGVAFTLLNSDSSHKERDTDAQGPLHDWSAYPHAQGPVVCWRQRYRRWGQGGDRWVFLNLMQPAPCALSLDRVGETTVRLSQEDAGVRVSLGYWGTGEPGPRLGQLALEADAFALRPGGWWLAGVTRVAWGQTVLDADEPVDCELDIAAGAGIIWTRRATTVRLLAEGGRADGQSAAGDPAAPAYLRLELEAGEHRLTGLEGPAWGQAGWLARALALDLLTRRPLPPPRWGQASRRLRQLRCRVAHRDQGAVGAISLAGRGKAGQLAAYWRAGGWLWMGEGGRRQGRLQDGAVLTSGLLADLDGDGESELYLGDDQGQVCRVGRRRDSATGPFVLHMASGRFGVRTMACYQAGPKGSRGLLVADGRGGLIALGPAGEVRWRRLGWRHPVSRICLLPSGVPETDMLLVATEAGTLALLEPGGEVRWSVLGGHPPTILEWWEGGSEGEGLLLAGSADGCLSAYDRAAGELRWQQNLGEDITFLHLGKDGVLRAVSLAGVLLEVERDGQERTRRFLTGSPVAGALLPDGSFLVGTREGELWRFSPTGQPLACRPLDAGVTCLAATETGIGWAGTQAGTLWRIRP